LPAEEIPHGAGGYVNYHCRCEVCTAGNTAAVAARRARLRAEREGREEK
jgi:hypothetical protein